MGLFFYTIFFSILPYMNKSLTLGIMGLFKRTLYWQIKLVPVKFVWKAKVIKTKSRPT